MANAYATLAADGLYCEPLPVLSITDTGRQARRRYQGRRRSPTPRCRQAVTPDVARAAADAARCVTGYGAAAAAAAAGPPRPACYGAVGRPVAGKTGTTDDTRAAWFVGFTPELAAASFIADPDNPFHVVGDGNS